MKMELIENPKIKYESLKRIHMKGSEFCLMLIHGYTGSPHDMKMIAERIHEETGYTVVVPRLPGHGTNGMDFLSTTHRDWIRRVADEYVDLSSEYDKVFVGGLSMGGVLTLILASMFKIPRIVLYAPAVWITVQRKLPLAGFISLFRKRGLKRDYAEEKYDDPGMEYLSKEYWRYNWFKQIYEFYKLQKVSWRRLKYVESPTLVILSKKDGIVPISAGEMIMKNISSREKRMVILEKSGHVITRDVELDTVVNETVRWLEGDRLG